jgi:CRISPR-associated protein Cmr6
MSSSNQPRKSQTPVDIWREFIQVELKSNSKLGKVFETAGCGGYDNKTLILYFPDEASCKTAKGQIKPLQEKLAKHYFLTCDRIDFRTGNVPPPPKTPAGQQLGSPQPYNPSKIGNPLQALNFASFGYNPRGEELIQPILKAAVAAEATCTLLYTKLNQRTRQLVGEKGIVITKDFNWRVRVGGTRGFRELLVPVLHPVFGIPYIPASSLKGAARAWARGEADSRIRRLLGILEGSVAQAAKVEFLDAFPTKPCLSVDVATPQWHWQNNKVVYQPQPHPLLSMEKPQLLIGLLPTSQGNSEDVKVVQEWLEKALYTGIGSRVSSGYGRALGQLANLPHSKSYNFELWTQGMYGSNPPSRENNWQGSAEFRPTAVRGILLYWFRAVVMGLYDPATCQTLQDQVFGKLGQQGKISISTLVNPAAKTNPYLYTGKIVLEATESKYLALASQLLILASHLGGVGRGSRRPLHLLNGRMRGCHWVVDGADMPLEYDEKKWQAFFQNLKAAFEKVQTSVGTHKGDPGRPRQRQQDVLDYNAQVWLLKSSGQVPPERVSNWQTEGNNSNIRGSALNLLYSSDRFKGENQQRQGNPNVGGALETPSFVWIKSLFPTSNSPYQVVTIFGTDHAERKAFANALRQPEAILVFGQKLAGNQPVPPQPPKHK